MRLRTRIEQAVASRRQRFASPDALTQAIHQAVEELMAEGLLSQDFAGTSNQRRLKYDGLCARMVQAYWRLTREPEFRSLADDPDVEPYKIGTGADAHYWIRLRVSGDVLELNAGPGERPDRSFPYGNG